MSFDTYDYLIKCLVIGDSGIGKSSLMLRFTNDVFSNEYISTIGVDFKIKTIALENKTIKYQIWDTAGQDRFRTITSSYYRGSNAILICYDVTEKETFQNVKKWLEEVKRYATGNPLLILCGTKSDLSNKRQISTIDGKNYATDNNMLFFETSAKNNLNVKEIFESIANNKINNKNNLINDINNKNNFINNKTVNLQQLNEKKFICC